MKNIILIVILNAIAFLGFAQDNNPVSWKFSSEKIAPLTYKVKFEATVEAPFHIYAQQASGGGLGMPTEFLFTSNDDIEFVGIIEEKGFEKTDGEEVAYYKGGVTFVQTIRLKSEKKKNLSGTIKYMACNDQMCLPPSKVEFTLAINSQDKSVALGSSSNVEKSPVAYSDFVIADPFGKSVSSKEVISKSKYTLIDFWASWCVPCRAQGRELVPLYDTYKSKGFSVIAISLDTKAEAWKRAIDADKYTWTNLCDLKGFESEVVNKYGITAIPKNFLIDDKGAIVAVDLRGRELESKLKELF